jgi:alkylation response protein AidB-like acyl-CoA dehydrogenase
MNFGFTDEQDQLRESVRRFLDERCPLKEVRRIQETPSGYDPALYREIAELGWLGITIPEAYGGAGMSWLDWVVILEETGKSLFPSPMISSALAATAILDTGSEAQKQRWLPALANGSKIATLAFAEESDVIDPAATALRGEKDGDGFVLTGEKCFVVDPESADLFVVSFRTGDAPDDVALVVVDADAVGLSAKSYTMIDETKRQGNVTFDGVRVASDALLGEARGMGAAIANILDKAAVTVTAEMSGAVDSALALTTQYAKDRIQFGHPIGHYQGVKHPLAEIYTDLESFKSLLYYAAWCLENRPDEVPRYASLAKAYASECFIRTGFDSITIHGAVGFAMETDIQLFFKRSKWARPIFGDANAHYERAFALRGA